MALGESARMEPGKWRRRALEALLVLMVLGFVRACQTRSNLRGVVPRTELSALGGQTIALGDMNDEPMILHFWATWCGVCRAEEANIGAIAKRARVISVASRSGSEAQVQSYVRAAGISYPVINDPSGELAQRYGVTAYPTTFFVRRDGVIVTSEVGYTTYLGLRARALWMGL